MSEQNSPPAKTPDVTSEAPAKPYTGPLENVRQERPRPDPTRYGDWEKNGRCIDF